jgi:hypothetical protein
VISKRSVGALLGLIVLLAAGTLVQDFRFDSLLARERANAAAIDRELASIIVSIADLRAAQAGYVATGQAPAAWMTRATEAFDRVTSGLEARKAAAPNADALAKYEASLKAVANLGSIDSRVRQSIAQEDRLHAGDLIFIDAQQAADAAQGELSVARAAEEQAATQRTGRLAMMRLGMNGLAIVFIMIIALYFGRSLSILRDAPPASTAQMIKDLPPPVKGTSTLNLSSGPSTQSATTVPAAPAITTPAGPAPRPVSLSAAAELCVDLARLLDGRDVPGLLERTAMLLDAKGIMIWAVDTGGALLRPSMCHGYSEKVLTRLRPLQVDGDNVTSLAFRSMQAQSLPGATAADSGAIAVPLITGSGCVGVLAAEVRSGKPHPDLLPIARIVAAQFSTLVAPLDNAQATAQG